MSTQADRTIEGVYRVRPLPHARVPLARAPAPEAAAQAAGPII